MMVLMETRRMCPHCRAFITTRDRICPYCNEGVAPVQVVKDEGVRVLGGLIPHVRFNTALILLINVGLYLATALFSSRMGNSQGFWSIDPVTLRQVEEVFGSSRMLVIYFCATAGGFYLSATQSPSDSVGASAALMGLMGAMIAFGVTSRSAIGSEIRSMYVRWVVIILVMGFVAQTRTDNWAHIGGLATGFALAWVAGTPRAAGSPVEWFWRVASWLAILLTGYSFLKMLLFFLRTTR
jgi:rhomboid protease GluP